MPDEKLSMIEHLEELRSRIIKSIVLLIVVSCILYNYVDVLISFLVKPVGKLVFIAPQEAFVANITLVFFGGLFLSSPFILYQVWKFVSVGLNQKERKWVLLLGPLSFIFLIVGFVFGYFIIVPLGLKFLLGFGTIYVSPMISISHHISFVGTLTLTFGLVFQLPIITLFLTKIGLVTPEFLCQKRRHAIVFYIYCGRYFDTAYCYHSGFNGCSFIALV